MKKLVLFFILLSAFNAFSQSKSGTLLSESNGTAIDTVTNTGTKSQVLAIAGVQDVVTILSTVTEISGTTGGTVKLYGSIDGTNYALIDTNTFSPADQIAAQSYAWSINPSKYTYYKVTYVGSGTMSAKISTKALWRR